MKLNWYILVGLVVFAAFIYSRYYLVWKPNKSYDQSHFIVFDETTLTLKSEDKENVFLWSNLEKITLHSNDKGPFEEDQFYELYFGGDDYLTLPAEFKGVSELVKDYILKLDGLDERMFIEAMGTTTNKSFEIYVK